MEFNIEKHLGFLEVKEACQYFDTYISAEYRKFNIIPTFGSENDNTMYKNPIAVKNLLNDKEKYKNDKLKALKYNKLVLMTFITAHLITRRLVDRPEVTSSYTALKYFIIHYYRSSIDRKLWKDLPCELVDHTKFSLISTIPLFPTIPFKCVTSNSTDSRMR